WRAVRDLRLEALQDPAAGMAFLDSYDSAAANSDEFWRNRTTGAATGDSVAQFVAEEDEWVGSVTVLRRGTPGVDQHGHVVGVYLRPSHRGQGLIDALLQTAADWTRSIGGTRLTLDVHVDNARAQAAYRRAGFTPTGKRMSTTLGEELEMTRPLASSDAKGGGR